MQYQVLSPLEEDVMNIVWELKECSVRDVVGRFGQERKLAYTTVATLLQRLFDKGLVERSSQGMTLSYTPKISKKSYSKKMAKTFIKTFISSFGETAIVSFAESIDKLPRDQKNYLLRLLEKQNEKK